MGRSYSKGSRSLRKYPLFVASNYISHVVAVNRSLGQRLWCFNCVHVNVGYFTSVYWCGKCENWSYEAKSECLGEFPNSTIATGAQYTASNMVKTGEEFEYWAGTKV